MHLEISRDHTPGKIPMITPKSLTNVLLLMLFSTSAYSAVLCYDKTTCKTFTPKNPSTGWIDARYRCLAMMPEPVTRKTNPKDSPEIPTTFPLGTLNKVVPSPYVQCGKMQFRKGAVWVDVFGRDLLGEFVQLQCGYYTIVGDCRTYVP